MKLVAPLLAALVTLVAAAPAGASAPPRARLAHFACHSTRDPSTRTVSVISVMRPISATRKLSVRFSLLERKPGATRPVSLGASGDLGRWLTPADPTLGQRPQDVWKLAKSVSDVDAPAAYRFRVDFRWLGRDGAVLGTASLRTPLCHERELRPDLLVGRVIVTPRHGHPHGGGRTRYVAVIANHGASASGPFTVSFTPGTGAAPSTKSVASLAPGAHVRVPFAGPACRAASPPTVVADAADQVDDFDRSNNTLTVACPQ
ncbi:MAG TPA: CARDB domain-containing protein [Solirubrobacteraceae bacterium]